MGSIYKDTKKLLSDAKFYEGYARFKEDEGRYETWSEADEKRLRELEEKANAAK